MFSAYDRVKKHRFMLEENDEDFSSTLGSVQPLQEVHKPF